MTRPNSMNNPEQRLIDIITLDTILEKLSPEDRNALCQKFGYFPANSVQPHEPLPNAAPAETTPRHIIRTQVERAIRRAKELAREKRRPTGTPILYTSVEAEQQFNTLYQEYLPWIRNSATAFAARDYYVIQELMQAARIALWRLCCATAHLPHTHNWGYRRQTLRNAMLRALRKSGPAKFPRPDET